MARSGEFETNFGNHIPSRRRVINTGMQHRDLITPLDSPTWDIITMQKKREDAEFGAIEFDDDELYLLAAEAKRLGFEEDLGIIERALGRRYLEGQAESA